MAWNFSLNMLRYDRGLQLQVTVLGMILGTSYYSLFMSGHLEQAVLSLDTGGEYPLPIFFDIFSALYMLISLLFFLVAVIYLWSSIRQRVLSKKKEIALMTAVGHPWKVRSFLFRESVVSIMLALVSGLVGAFLLAKVIQLLSGYVPPFPVFLGFIYTLVFLLVAAFSASHVTTSLLEKSFQEIRETGFPEENDLYRNESSMEGLETGNAILSLFSKLFLAGRLPITRKIALRTLKRTFHLTKYYFVLVILLVTALTAALGGGFVVRDTTKAYLDDFYGETRYLVTFNYTAGFFLPFFDFTGINDTSYSPPRQWVDVNAFTSRVSNISKAVDDRILVYTVVREVAAVIFEQGEEKSIGQARRTHAVVQGISPLNLAQSWSYSGANPAELPRGKVVIGDWLAAYLFTSPFRESLKVFEGEEDQSFFQGPVVSTVMDPLGGGKTVYTRVEDLVNLLNLNIGARNAFFVDLASASDEPVLEQLAGEFGMEVYPLGGVLSSNKGWINRLWILTVLLTFPSLAVLVVTMVMQQRHLFEIRRQVFAVLQVLGARKRTMSDIFTVESRLLIVSGLVVGYSVGLFLAITLLIEDTIVTVETFLVPLVVLVITAVLIALAVKRVVERKIEESVIS
ncbi:MAG: FtsX-like permease family protein [Candidatus Odinarchaeota archaeon]